MMRDARPVDVMRSPDEQLRGLPGFPYEPHFVEVPDPRFPGLRIGYVDEGPVGEAPIVLLHGQPTWSYVYRTVIAELVDRGFRVVAPDLVGYGRSDKPTDRTAYSLASHIAWMRAWFDVLQLRDVTLVCQDWGGPIGLGVLAAEPDRCARVVATNTILHTADPSLAGRLSWAVHGVEGEPRVVVQDMLLDYMLASQRYPWLPSQLVNAATVHAVPADVLAAYDAPFTDESATAGLRQMSVLIPVTRSDPGAVINRATTEALRQWTKPFLTAYSDQDVATAGWAEVFQELVPGARGQPHTTIANAGHFVQEDAGPELARTIAGFIRSS
jgi:haloalkane dehalogenase